MKHGAHCEGCQNAFVLMMDRLNNERCPICLCVTHVGPHGPGVCLPAAYPPEIEGDEA